MGASEPAAPTEAPAGSVGHGPRQAARMTASLYHDDRSGTREPSRGKPPGAESGWRSVAAPGSPGMGTVNCRDSLGRFPVDCVVVLAAQKIVVHPGRCRPVLPEIWRRVVVGRAWPRCECHQAVLRAGAATLS